MGRFINGDAYAATSQGLLGNNMFAYCGNNPITRGDEGGNYWHVLIGAAVNGTIALACSIVEEIIEAQKPGEKFEFSDAAQIFIGVTIASAEGALCALCPSASAGICAGASLTETIIDGAIDKQNPKKIARDAFFSAGISAAAGAAGSEIAKGKKLLSETVDAIGKASADGARPLLQKTAQKYLVKATRFIGKNLLTGLGEKVAYDGMSKFAEKYTDLWLASMY